MLIIIDGNGLAHRIWHALKLSKPSRWIKTDQDLIDDRAGLLVHSFLDSTLEVYKAVLNRGSGRKGKYPWVKLIICWDSITSSRSRKVAYPDYKANRKTREGEFAVGPVIHHIKTKLQGVHKRFSLEGVDLEGDDIITIVANYASIQGWESIIVSRDRDFYQLLADENIMVYDSYDDTWTDANRVWQTFKVGPDWVPYYKAIAGDSSDNWKGVKGWGPKAALQKIIEIQKVNGDLTKLYPPDICDTINLGLKLVTLPTALVDLDIAMETVIDAFEDESEPVWDGFMDEFGIEAKRQEFVEWFT